MSNIERRRRVSRRRVTRNGRRVTDPATAPVGDDPAGSSPQKDVRRDRVPDMAADRMVSRFNSSTVVPSDRYRPAD
jgi:hypothetical protein